MSVSQYHIIVSRHLNHKSQVCGRHPTLKTQAQNYLLSVILDCLDLYADKLIPPFLFPSSSSQLGSNLEPRKQTAFPSPFANCLSPLSSLTLLSFSLTIFPHPLVFLLALSLSFSLTPLSVFRSPSLIPRARPSTSRVHPVYNLLLSLQQPLPSCLPVPVPMPSSCHRYCLRSMRMPISSPR